MNSITQKNLRLIPAGVMAVAISFPVALISLSKLLLLLSGIYILFIELKKANIKKTLYNISSGKLTSIHALIILSFIYTLTSLFWTSAPESSYIKSLLQHGNLLIIPLLALHIKTKEEAHSILRLFCIGQFFVVISSWLIFIELKPLWAIATVQKYAVFSSELDQSIMNALFAAILWHLRKELFPNFAKYVFIPIFLSIVCVFYIFEGRTGHIVMFALISISFWWLIPKKLKIFGFVAPIIFIFVLFFTSDVLQQRFEKVAPELERFSQHQDATTSTGTRLDFWFTAIKIAEKNPIFGSGAGSWSNEFNSMKNNSSISNSTGNPHQEYLLWLVELGLLGVLLLLTIFFVLYKKSLAMNESDRHANISVLIGVMLACMFNCALHDALIGDFLCFIIGLLLMLDIDKKTELKYAK